MLNEELGMKEAVEGRPTILVVDDRPDNLLIIEDVLCEDFLVRTASSGEAALQAVQSLPRPNLILLDLRMPGMDGLAVLAHLKANPDVRDIPVIFVTAADEEEDEERGLEGGAVDYVTKPIQPRSLLARVRTHLALSRAQQALEYANQNLERRVAERTVSLQRAMVAAEAANLAKSQFLANMGDEIRTPMNGILGMLEILLETETNPECRELAMEARNSAQALMVVLGDVLQFAAADAGQERLELKEFQPVRLMADLGDLYRRRAVEKGLTLVCQADLDLPKYLMGDVVRLRQVLIKLVDNAVKFTDAGEVLVEAKLAGKQTGQFRLRVEVRDTGVGMAEEKVREMFQPFIQADNSLTSNHRGIGLGLAIAHRLVRLMGGKIGFEPHLPQGSMFWVEVDLEMA